MRYDEYADILSSPSGDVEFKTWVEIWSPGRSKRIDGLIMMHHVRDGETPINQSIHVSPMIFNDVTRGYFDSVQLRWFVRDSQRSACLRLRLFMRIVGPFEVEPRYDVINHVCRGTITDIYIDGIKLRREERLPMLFDLVSSSDTPSCKELS